MFTNRQLKAFWDKVDVKGPLDCWNWKASKSLRGRPVFNPSGCQKLGISYLSYRVSWVIHYGLVPPGMCVLHSCDNPLCCNPEHLFLGTSLDNTIDMLKKGRGGKAKLNELQVMNIRKDERPRREIASEYGITLNMIQKIKSRHSWRHL